MILRIIGAVCILGAAILLGIAHNEIARKRAAVLESRAEFFARLREKISYDRSDLATAMRECTKDEPGGFAVEISNVCTGAKVNGRGFYEAWIANADCRYPIKEEDNHIIDEFMRAADNGSVDAVIAAADNAVQKINQNLKELREYNEKNKKVFASLWIYSGIFLVIMLM